MLRVPIPKALRFRAFRVFRGEPPRTFSVISACSVVSHPTRQDASSTRNLRGSIPRPATTDRTDRSYIRRIRRIRGQSPELRRFRAFHVFRGEPP